MKLQLSRKTLSETAYPAITIVLLLAIAGSFVYTTGFLATQINSALSVNEEAVNAELVRVSQPDLRYVAGRLGISLPESSDGAVGAETGSAAGSASSTASSTQPTAVSPAPPAAPPTLELSIAKDALTVQVLNSTRVMGLAGKLKTSLEQAGFKVQKTGNASPFLGTTVIKVKPSLKVYAQTIEELKRVVAASYPDASIEDAEHEAPADVVVVIGGQN